MNYIKEMLGLERLQLTSEQESAYLAFYAQNYVRYRRTVLVLSLILIALIGIFDFYVYGPDNWAELIRIRYGFGVPMVVLLTWFALSHHFEAYQQEHVTLCCVFFSSVLAAMLLVAPADVIKMYQPGFLIVVFFAGAIARLVFCRAAFVCLFVAVAMNVLMILRPQPLTWMLSFNFFYASAVAMALGANYYISISTRKEFLSAKVLEENCQELTESNISLAEQASTDPLTGLFNRRELEKAFDREIRRAIRHQAEISLLMIDVDHFKKYNDYFGHQRGDECLISIAKMMQGVFARGGDIVARYGGEEFAVLLPETDNKAAVSLASHLMDELKRMNLDAPPGADKSGKVTASVGLMSIMPSVESEPSVLIQLADNALYRAKRNGRNCIFNFNGSEAVSA